MDGIYAMTRRIGKADFSMRSKASSDFPRSNKTMSRDLFMMNDMTQYTLATLVESIDNALCAPETRRAPELTAALHAALVQTEWLPPDRRRASYDRYVRHLIYADPLDRFSVFSIVWGHQQASPIHGHRAWCAMGVFRGEVTETMFRAPRVGRPPELICNIRRTPGSTSFDAPVGNIHRIVNPHEETAITLHIYGVGASGVDRINQIYE